MAKSEKMQNIKLIFISVVVPSVNGNQAKLLVIQECEFEKLKKYSSSNFSTNSKPYAMFVESNSLHQFLGNGGYLTREQFAGTLREFYNSINGEIPKKH
jgi:hypothetical protein